ncbi:hypothetical protein ONS96_007790 [Cadophora gregata f. sp. sojae]|nr:hypothetical protein ONS96_007790 [Cadophora gregata f. sp. sojae]
MAAGATDNSMGGIFIDRVEAEEYRRFCLPIPHGDSHGILSLYKNLDEHRVKQGINCLCTRAWCLQEAKLSHSLLTFDRVQVPYTGVRQGLVESRDVPIILARENRNHFLAQFQQVPSDTLIGEPSNLRHMIISWYNIIYDYTRCDLTFSSDKLVAISGIAKVVGDCI